MFTNEKWKLFELDGRKKHRYISSAGRVKDLNGKLLPLSDNGAGYLSFSLMYSNGKAGRFYIHRAVAMLFLVNGSNHPQVNHINCDKADNSVTNLEWISASKNIIHAHEAGRMVKRSNLGKIEHLTEQEVIDSYLRVKKGETITSVAKSIGRSRTTLSSIMNKVSRSDITDKLDEQLANA